VAFSPADFSSFFSLRRRTFFLRMENVFLFSSVHGLSRRGFPLFQQISCSPFFPKWTAFLIIRTWSFPAESRGLRLFPTTRLLVIHYGSPTHLFLMPESPNPYKVRHHSLWGFISSFPSSLLEEDLGLLLQRVSLAGIEQTCQEFMKGGRFASHFLGIPIFL